MNVEEQKTYRIGEVAEMLNLKTYVLRFWETEFSQIEPLRTETGHRVYTDNHIATLRRIQELLHERGMTIEGARRALAGEPVDEEKFMEAAARGLDSAFLHMLETELNAIRKLLEDAAQ